MTTTRPHFFQGYRRTTLASALTRSALANSQHHLPLASLVRNRFSIAGFQYYDGPALIRRLRPVTSCVLTRESRNPQDPFAVDIHQGQVMLGYVPPLGQPAHQSVDQTRGAADLSGGGV